MALFSPNSQALPNTGDCSHSKTAKEYVSVRLSLLTRQMYSEKTPGVGLKHLLLKCVLSVMFGAGAEFEAVSLAEAVSVLGPEQG